MGISPVNEYYGEHYGRLSRIGIAAAVLKTEGPKRVCEFESHAFRQIWYSESIITEKEPKMTY
jgi:hypothetical protein